MRPAVTKLMLALALALAVLLPFGAAFAEESAEPLRISAAPVPLTTDGVYDNAGAVIAELSADGEIFYTLDGSLPTAASRHYEGPVTLTETTVLRAVSIEQGSLPSQVLTQTYIINRYHSLPVVSLALDDPEQFEFMYKGKKKDMEIKGNLAFYDGDDGFSVPCGVDMHGDTSLSEKKKNLGIELRRSYGVSTLDYDLFGGGLTEFSSLILRAGQDQRNAIIRNELIENLALRLSDSLVVQRNRYCVLYVNGSYYGIYAITEKVDKDSFAHREGVKKKSVTVLKSPVGINTDFYAEIIDFARKNDLRIKENYEEFCRRMDVDSLIDWMIIEGFSQNTDLNPGNVRYCRTTEGDGKWRHMLYDLDAVLHEPKKCYQIVMEQKTTPYAAFIQPLLKNEDFRKRFLERAAGIYSEELTNGNVLAEIDRLCELIRPELERDLAINGNNIRSWESNIDMLRKLFTEKDWCGECTAAICRYLGGDSADYFRR